MKKVILNVLLVFVTVFQMSAQIDEKKLTLSDAQMNVSGTTRTSIVAKLDCQCGSNIVADGGFQGLTTYTGSSNISPASSPWKPNTNTPQWTPVAGACDKGFISMWGNQAVFESVKQAVTVPSAGCYKIKFTARFANLNPPNSTNVSLKVTIGTATMISSPISNLNWDTYSMTITGVPTGPQTVILQPTNSFNVNDGNFVSWLQIDKICIEKCCPIPDEKCSPKFTVAPFTLNSQCNVIANFNPVVTSGAQHYWGLVSASGVGDITPVPLANILSGGTFGLGISPTGVATPIGMGTGINASTSGYGYHYEGVGLGTCFKITHYIKCCDKWYSQTKTYCPKLCSDTKESDVIEVPVSSVPQQLNKD